ncbi:MAG: glycosyltransferase [Bacteroidales bacterium]|nr:glycosyltransferase [Bacteroidales bacterium]
MKIIFPNNSLHIVAFDIPYPPNYGGVIDVYYKLISLHKKGINIILHCFEYPGRDRAPILEKYCSKVYYYERKLGFLSGLSMKPYIVKSRRSEEMIKNLLKDDYPILFEGLHSCYAISDKRLKNRVKIYRESNIEHKYYYNLYKVEKNIFKKIYFLSEGLKLRVYQYILKHASIMLVVSQHDTDYLKKNFKKNSKIYFLPSFHANNTFDVKPGKGKYALYHGNIEVPENAYAASFLINEVFKYLDFKLIIAGSNPPQNIVKLVDKTENVELISNPPDEKMFELIREAHINVLVTFQATGLKLKLLNVLYNGRFCLVNNEMLNGTGLDDLCFKSNSADELIERIKKLFLMEFDVSQVEKRKEKLQKHYSNSVNVARLLSLIS